MILFQNQQWIADIDLVLEGVPELNQLAGKSVLITGATGLICSAVVDMLIRYNDMHTEKIQIYAAGRSQEAFDRRFGKQSECCYFHFVHYDASAQEPQLQGSWDYIIHGASNADPTNIINQPVETMVSNFLGVRGLLDIAKNKNAKRVLFISSSEVYGQKNISGAFEEDEYGSVDLMNPRNSYAEGKRAAEMLCISYAAEYDVDVVLARPGHIYGPTASPNDSRVSSVWAHNASKGEPIIMKSKGLQIRSYCYCLDCAAAILKIMIKGKARMAYNISNTSSVITIHQLAAILADAGHVQLIQQIPEEKEQKAFNPMNNSSLCSDRLQALGWQGYFDAELGLQHTVSILREQCMEKHGTADILKKKPSY